MQKILFEEALLTTEMLLIGLGEDSYTTQEEKNEVYSMLKKIVSNKNYFIITLKMDGSIKEFDFIKERIVEPCGNYYKLQCTDACTEEIYEATKEVVTQINKAIEEKRELEIDNLPDCPHCGKKLVFHTCTQENYIEKGYLSQWEIYTKWLQGTLNRKLCILELGVGMKYPTVIRWPFEKIAFFNQQASFFRVHSKLYQVSAELGNRGAAIPEKPVDFLKEIC